jgi:hypothetical protein
MGRTTDKSAESTYDKVPSANTDALLDAIPGVLSKTVELSSNLPPNDPNRISEELHSATIDASSVNTRVVVAEEAPNDAEERPGVSIDFADAVAGATALPPSSCLAHPPLWNAWWCEACTVLHFVGDGGELIGSCHELSRTPGLTYAVLNPSATSRIRKTSSNTPNTTSENNKLPGISHASPGGTNSMVGDDAPRMDNDSLQPSKIDGKGATGTRRSIRPTLPMTSRGKSHLPSSSSDSNISSSDTSSGTDLDDAGPTASGSSSPISSRSYYYHAPFTMYSKCYGKRPDNFTRYKYLILKAMKSRSTASNRSNPWVKIIDKWNQPSKTKVPLTTIDDDLHIGDDGLFSQSTFSDGLLADEEHLKSLCPTNTLLPRIFIQNEALPFLVEQLCQTVLHLKSLQDNSESLSILKKKGGKTTINVFRIPASECSLGLIDGAEFFQWTYRNHQAQLWYCPSIKKSPFKSRRLRVQSRYHRWQCRSFLLRVLTMTLNFLVM